MRSALSTSLAQAMNDVQGQLAKIGTISFTEILRDGSNEDKFAESQVTIGVSDVVVDVQQCGVSYDQTFRRNQGVDNKRLEFSLRAAENIVIEPFELFDKRAGEPARICVYLDQPQGDSTA